MNPMTGLRLLENLQSSLKSKKDEIASIDKRISEAITEIDKVIAQKENPPQGEGKIDFITRANNYLSKLEKEISNLREARDLLVKEENKLKLKLAEFDRPRLEKEIKEAEASFNRLVNEYLSCLPQLFNLKKQLIAIAEQYDLRVPQELSNTKVFKYQNSLQGKDISEWEEFVRLNMNSLKIGGWIYYKIKE